MHPHTTIARLLVLFGLFCAVVPAALAQTPQTVAFQGHLTDAEGTPLDGEVDLSFRVYDEPTGGTTRWAEEQSGVAVSDGVFSVQLGRERSLSGLTFDGPLWLAIYVDDGDELEPRVPLSAVPYSFQAGTLDDGAITAGDNVSIKREGRALVISAEGGGADSTLTGWRLNGNRGTDPSSQFIGTTDMTPVDIRVNDARVVRYEPPPDASEEGPNVIAGWSGNAVSDGVVGATISGGGDPSFTNSGGYPNWVLESYGSVGGGIGNRASGGAAVAGGILNTANGSASAIAGGWGNEADGQSAAVPGGRYNKADGDYSLAAGLYASALHDGTFVWQDAQGSSENIFSSTGDNQFLIQADGGVGIGTNAPSSPLTVVGMVESTEGGFKLPDGTVLNDASDVGGGGGGGGGSTSSWQLGGNSGTSAEKNFIGTTDKSPLEIKVGDARVMRFEPAADPKDGGPNVVGGWSGNQVDEGVVGATIAGGGALTGGARADPNRIGANYGTIGGGMSNTVSNTWSTVSGGYLNTASGPLATVSGGINNTAGAGQATVAGGDNNNATGLYSSVGGGTNNRAVADYSAVPGGAGNVAGGQYSFAAGRSAKVRDADVVGDKDGDEGTFVWADSGPIASPTDFVSTGPDQFLIRAAGGVGIGTNAPSSPLTVVGTIESTKDGFKLPDGTVLNDASDLGGAGPLGDVFHVDGAARVGLGTTNPSDKLQIDAESGEDALRVRIAGTTRLRVHDNGGVSIGANTGPPAEGLVVRGDIAFQDAQTRWLSLGPWAFTSHDAGPGIGASAAHGGDRYLRCPAGQSNCENGAAVHLPHGANITELRALVDDNTPLQDVTVRLIRMSHANGSTSTMATTKTNGVTGDRTVLVDSSISNAAVDNENFAYYVETLHGNSSVGLYTVRLTYTVTSPMP